MLKLCIPVVTREGLEVHGQLDCGMMRVVGTPKWLIAHNLSEFEQVALRVIERGAERMAPARKLREVDAERVFSDRPGNDFFMDIADAVWYAYRNHELIQRSKGAIGQWQSASSFKMPDVSASEMLHRRAIDGVREKNLLARANGNFPT